MPLHRLESDGRLSKTAHPRRNPADDPGLLIQRAVIPCGEVVSEISLRPSIATDATVRDERLARRSA
jgi:hypothetical protein